MTDAHKEYFTQIAAEILHAPVVQEMRKYPQHGMTNALCHMVSVAWTAYQKAVTMETKLGIRFDKRSLIRGALLHDLFLYDWHDPNNGHKLHGFSHPYTALEHAQAHFALNRREKNIIVRHMFPFTPIPPRYRESMLVSWADKVCSARETKRRRESCGVCHVCPLAAQHHPERSEA